MSLDRGSVVTVTPLTVTLDTSSTPLPAINACAPTLHVGDRVLVEKVGKAGGQIAVVGQISSPRTQSGVLNVTPVAGVYTSAPIAFAVGRFTSVPIVQVTADVSAPFASGSITFTGVDSRTTVGCNIGVVRSNTTVTPLMWTATEDNA